MIDSAGYPPTLAASAAPIVGAIAVAAASGALNMPFSEACAQRRY
jgi:hypothetical protein